MLLRCFYNRMKFKKDEHLYTKTIEERIQTGQYCEIVTIFLYILRRSCTFAAVKQLAMTYQVNEVLQRIILFFASFCTLSLVNPNNLLTHTHTHTHTHTLAPGVTKTFFLFAYARAKRAVSPINKGLFEVLFVSFFMPFCKLYLEQNKNEITIILININRMR